MKVLQEILSKKGVLVLIGSKFTGLENEKTISNILVTLECKWYCGE